MAYIGYEFLRNRLDIPVFELKQPARIASVRRTQLTPEEGLLVPKEVAPKSEDLLEHTLFALKHEGTNLQVLSEVMTQIPADQIIKYLRASPSGLFIRKACYLWEHFNGKELEGSSAAIGPYGDLFDADRYITGPAQKNNKWRVNFNGLGSIDYCPSVERTDLIRQGVEIDILGRTRRFLEEIGAVNADRALSWAYLSETESSFAIEHEKASVSKAEAYVALLKKAHDGRQLSEEYLVELQSETLTNPFAKEASFRHQQNWLRRGGVRGSGSVSYVPPAPELMEDLMSKFLAMSNAISKQIDPIVAASVSSFGFVYLHPFMDGNGRLSRFIFHHALCQSGELKRGLLLPVSVAMKCNESEYLAALETFSKPARRLWDVRWIDEDRFDLAFKGKDAIYRYWDATPCVEFGLKMADQALNVHLTQEMDFLARFDRISGKLNDRYDVRSDDLHVLLLSALQNEGVVSKNRRKQYSESVPGAFFDYLEACVRAEIGSSPKGTSGTKPKNNSSGMGI